MVQSPNTSPSRRSKPPKESKIPNIPWYYVTRVIGAITLLFGVFGDASAERGTLILTGAGLLGIDKVARSDSTK